MCLVRQLFEGMKAYRGVDNIIRYFRPFDNMDRMSVSAARCALPVSCEPWIQNSISHLSFSVSPAFFGLAKTLTLWLRRAAHSGSRKVYFRTASRCQRLAVNTTFQTSYWCIATQWMVLANGVPSERLPHNKLALIMSDGALQTVQYNRSMCIGIARSVDSQQRWRIQEVHM